jgi:hypothetical protein
MKNERGAGHNPRNAPRSPLIFGCSKNARSVISSLCRPACSCRSPHRLFGAALFGCCCGRVLGHSPICRMTCVLQPCRSGRLPCASVFISMWKRRARIFATCLEKTRHHFAVALQAEHRYPAAHMPHENAIDCIGSTTRSSDAEDQIAGIMPVPRA